MSGHLPPVEAYRRDLVRLRRTTSFGDEDDGWLLLAHVVHQRASSVPPVEGGPDDAGETSGLRRLAAVVAGAQSLDAAQVAELSAVALRMESAGALLLAASTLASLERLLGDSLPLERGRVIAQWARVERLLGETDVAADLYARAAGIGTRHKLPDLRVRADVGLGVLARMRGNYPEARQRFRRALALAERNGLAELTGFAHQSLMIAAAVARDFDTALSHGWAAFAHVAGDAVQEAEVLLNLASLCLDTGENEAALQGFLSAADRTSKERVRVAARAGAAVAAARLGDRALLDACAGQVEQALLGDMAPYERAQRLLTLSDAWRAANEVIAAEDARSRGVAIALAHGFAELAHEYGEAITGTHAAPSTDRSPLGADGRRVVVALSALGDRAVRTKR